MFLKISCMFLTLIFCMGLGMPAAGAEDISAKAAIVMEAVTGEVLYEKNARAFLPMASTTKIMSAILTLESGTLDEEFVVDSEAIKVEGSSMGLREGDVVSKRDLVIGMLLPSGNDAANAAAVKISGNVESFSGLMNDKAREIGMEDSFFVTPSGLHDDRHGSTAYDMALLARYAMKNQDFMGICSQQTMKLCYGNPPYDRWLKNSNKLLGMYQDCVGMKTGFTDEAGRCLISVADRNGVRVICVTLNAPNDWQDHTRLFDESFAKLKAYNLKVPELPQAKVVGGDVSDVELVAGSSPKKLALRNEDVSKIDSQIFLPRFCYAPVTQGDVLGRLVYTYDGEVIDSIPLVARASIEMSGNRGEDTGLFSWIMGLFGRNKDGKNSGSENHS